MELLLLSGHIGTIVFLLPPFRQTRNYFFPLFLIMGLAGPFGYLLYALKINQNIILLLSSHIILMSLHFKYLSPKHNILLGILYLIISFAIYFFTDYVVLFSYFIFLQGLIVVFIANRMLKIVHKYLEIRIFHAVLLLYQITLIGKYLSLIIDLNSGIQYFLITNFFQILIAVFFIFVREDSKSCVIRLTKDYELIHARIFSSGYHKWDV